MKHFIIDKEEWDNTIEQLLLSYTIFAPVDNEFGQDYELIKPDDIPGIIYNRPRPATPLKNFFLPIRENVTSARNAEKARIIMGVPNCDIEGLNLLDSVYLNNDYKDIFYEERRENTLLISSDCFVKQDHCHCLFYDIKPYAGRIADLAVMLMGDKIILRIITLKGEEFVSKIGSAQILTDSNIFMSIEEIHNVTEISITLSGIKLPDYRKTGNLVSKAGKEIWEKYSSHCVSCGACTAICPTCTCFLLIDKPGFEKVKQADACQYPGFERVAGGEDALFELKDRFRNRYLCKYVWKPERFNSIACTGCGRCIDACIGKINKNELLMELNESVNA